MVKKKEVEAVLLEFETMSEEEIYRMVHEIYSEGSFEIAKATHERCGFKIEQENGRNCLTGEVRESVYGMIYEG